MRLGIFARTFRRLTLADTLDAIRGYGLREVHFNLACIGLETLPAELTTDQCRSIRECFAQRGLTMCGISGTFNAIHPDKVLRAELMHRTCDLITHCSDLGTQLVTLCTGTRFADDMWTDHPANRDVSAWDDLCATLTELLKAAERCNVYLGIEPEHSNVVNSIPAARRLLDELHSPRLKIVLDAANLLNSGNLAQTRYVLDESINLLGEKIIMAHAKDKPRSAGASSAAGQGLLDWEYYLQKLHQLGFHGPLVMHNLSESEVPGSVSFLNDLLGKIQLPSH